ncbi:hypothetical protein JOS77_16680 [Chromobacterium haemolyticum]|nr:hypothetical protein JOS77_16680 [Chromobacterium haemolyticum]
MLAGGYDAAQAFSGGKIKLGASNRIHGAVLAGDTLDTAGSTHIYGPVSAALQSRPPGAPPPNRPLNSLGAETVIDISGQNGLPGDGGGTPNPQTGARRGYYGRAIVKRAQALKACPRFHQAQRTFNRFLTSGRLCILI